MANEINKGSPMKIDTAGVIIAAGEPFLYRKFRWVSEAAAAGHNVVIKDKPPGGAAQRVIWESTALGANFIDESPSRPPGRELYSGCEVTTIDSGVLYLYY